MRVHDNYRYISLFSLLITLNVKKHEFMQELIVHLLKQVVHKATTMRSRSNPHLTTQLHCNDCFDK